MVLSRRIHGALSSTHHHMYVTSSGYVKNAGDNEQAKKYKYIHTKWWWFAQDTNSFNDRNKILNSCSTLSTSLPPGSPCPLLSAPPTDQAMPNGTYTDTQHMLKSALGHRMGNKAWTLEPKPSPLGDTEEGRWWREEEGMTEREEGRETKMMLENTMMKQYSVC